MKTYLSLGWGVQSFAIAAMVALGDLPPITAAIHADTTHESEHTYAFAERWGAWLEARGVKLTTVSAESSRFLAEIPNGGLTVNMPAFTVSPKGKAGQLRRSCTDRWKIRPIRTAIRPMLGKSESATLWLGISTDEIQRAKDSNVKYLQHAYPLLDKNMSRNDCVAYLQSHGLEVPPKSACHFCPFHNNRYWQAMKRENGSDWQNAVLADEAIRFARPGKVAHTLYLHSSGKPLVGAVVIPEDFGHEQGTFDLDNAACDSGHCFL
jgi:hypothetical protein